MRTATNTNDKAWIKRWKNWIKPTKLPGVWERKEGGYLVRKRVVEKATGRMHEVKKVLPDADAATAYKWLQDAVEQAKHGDIAAPKPKTRFSAYAVSLLERKVAQREIRSAKSRKNWGPILKFLIDGAHYEGEVPVRGLGEFFIDQLHAQHIEAWREDVAKRITAGQMSPHTANTRMTVLKIIMKAAKREFRLPRLATEDLKKFDTSEHDTFTEEEPNSLTLEEVPVFLARLRELYPQHYAMTYVGFALGLRPSSLRPLRRTGPNADVLWDENVILVRRSQTVGEEVMNTTKTKKKQRTHVPAALIDVLRWHVQTQLGTPEMQESELLFPAITGGFRSATVLNKPFGEVSTEIGLGKRFTQKGMRRTFQDLARGAGLREEVQKRICGHITDEMKERYSTVGQGEQREAIGKVLGLMGNAPANDESGAPGGAPSAESGAPERKAG
jgi:integrase